MYARVWYLLSIEPITLDHVTQYLQAVDPHSAARVTSLYQGLPQALAPNAPLPPSTQQQEIADAQQVYDLLKQHETEYVARSSLQTFAHALQEARVVVQGVQLQSNTLNDPHSLAQANQQRDAFMAENIDWLHEHADGGSKLVLWAHDAHIQTVTQGGYTPMGMHLRERYQSQYLAIGMSFYQGAFNARGENGTLHSFTVQASEQESYNALFGHAGFSLFALDLRHIPGGAVGQWMNGPHGFLTVGALYHSAAGLLSANPVSVIQYSSTIR
jgi:erythromycin esterase